MAYHGCAFGSMSFEDEAKLTSLIPAMDATVGASTIAEAIFIKCRACELSLREPLAKRAMLEELLGCISWMPKLQSPSCYRSKSQVIWLFGPLHLQACISTRRYLNNHFLPVYVVNAHHVIVAAVDAGNVSLAGAEAQ